MNKGGAMKKVAVFLVFSLLLVEAQTLSSAVKDAIVLGPGLISASVLDDTSSQNFKDGSRYATFKIDLKQGSVTEFRATADFDAYLTLYSPSFELLQTNDEADDSDGDDTNYESLIIQEAPESGTYLLVVSGYHPTSVGSFEVTAKDLVVVDDSTLTLPTSLNAVLSSGEDISEDGRLYDAFTLELEAPATLIFSMHSNTLDSYLRVYDADGNLLGENDDKVFVDDPATTDKDESNNYTRDAEVKLELEAGTYEVRALAFVAGFYQLSVQSE
jgi:hypothetical protein